MKKSIFTRIIAIALAAMSIMAIATTACATTYSYTGYVTASSLPIRSDTNTSSSVLGYYTMGQQITVYTCSNRAWFRVNYNNQTGYVYAKHIGIHSGYANAVVAYSGTVYLYSDPANPSSGFTTLPNETGITVLYETYGNFTRVSNLVYTGWIRTSAIYYG